MAFLLAALLAVPGGLAEEPRGAPEPRPIELPMLLSPERGYDLDFVCAEARRQGRRQAAVGLKSHACDHYEGACLKLTRSMSDPCNRFLFERFARFHTRTILNPAPRREGEVRPYDPSWFEAHQAVQEAWGKLGPILIVVDVPPEEECRVLTDILPSKIGGRAPDPLTAVAEMEDGVLAALSELSGDETAEADLRGRAAAMLERLASEEVPATCGRGRSASLLEVWRELDVQAGVED